ncbi:uncharacterized protein V6R79_007505 [Siganus canaliculatus]
MVIPGRVSAEARERWPRSRRSVGSGSCFPSEACAPSSKQRGAGKEASPSPELNRRRQHVAASWWAPRGVPPYPRLTVSCRLNQPAPAGSAHLRDGPTSESPGSRFERDRGCVGGADRAKPPSPLLPSALMKRQNRAATCSRSALRWAAVAAAVAPSLCHRNGSRSDGWHRCRCTAQDLAHLTALLKLACQ